MQPGEEGKGNKRKQAVTKQFKVDDTRNVARGLITNVFLLLVVVQATECVRRL